VSWEPISQAYVHGVLLGYEVRFAKDDGSPLNWETKMVDAYTHKTVLSSLSYFTRYKVAVCAKTSKGCGKEYSAVSYTWGDGEYMDMGFDACTLTKKITPKSSWVSFVYGLAMFSHEAIVMNWFYLCEVVAWVQIVTDMRQNL